MAKRYLLFSLFFLGALVASAGSSAAPNYTDQEMACLNVCRERDICHGGRGARDNSPRCKRCVAACSREREREAKGTKEK